MEQTRTAFALAGLGGFNAHGAGFLEAARANAYEPDLITATSGQIVVLASYLRGEPDLKKGLIDPALANDPLAQWKVAVFGYAGVFQPAIAENVARLLSPPYAGFDVDFYADRFLPAQLYKPARTAETIRQLVDTFNSSHIGVVFNAYEPTSGKGVLYGNDAARARLETKTHIPLVKEQIGNDPRLAKDGEAEDAVLPITESAIRSALWLSLYGFTALPHNQMDGAYHRSCIISELHNFDEVIVCRPLANGWRKDRLPKSYFDVQDWNTEMWFSVGYKAEVDAMKRINSLVRQGAFNAESGIKFVHIHEVEPDTPAGYFNYFIERESVFEDARRKAAALFQRLKDGEAGPKPTD